VANGPDARRRFVAGTLACASALALRGRDALAQAPRGGTIRLVVGFVPGGASDRVARVLAPELARLAGRAAIVENIPGANGARAIARVSSSEPDGDTLLFASSAIAHPDNAAGASALRPVIVTSTTPMVLVVRASMPVHDAREFARYLSTRSGTTYGSAGVGNATHLCAAELVERLGVEATHIPYNGSTPALGDLMGGHIDFLTMGVTPGLSQQAAVRMLAVSTRSRSRLPTTVSGRRCTRRPACRMPSSESSTRSSARSCRSNPCVTRSRTQAPRSCRDRPRMPNASIARKASASGAGCRAERVSRGDPGRRAGRVGESRERRDRDRGPQGRCGLDLVPSGVPI
jgi:tripartite-type tricarboxylate transporter receptor subunit TctC